MDPSVTAKFPIDILTSEKESGNDDESSSKSEEMQEDCKYSVHDLKSPFIPIQLADDCDLSQNFIHLEKLVNKMIKTKEKMETKIRKKNQVDIEMINLGDQIEEENKKVNDWWNKIKEKEEAITTKSNTLEEMKCSQKILEKLTYLLTEKQKLEKNIQTTAVKDIQSLKEQVIKVKVELEQLNLRIKAAIRKTADKTEVLYNDPAVTCNCNDQTAVGDLTVAEIDAAMKNVEEMKSNTQAEVRKMREEANQWKKGNVKCEKWVNQNTPRYLQMKKRSEGAAEEIKRELVLLKEIQQEIKNEKDFILRAHSIK